MANYPDPFRIFEVKVELNDRNTSLTFAKCLFAMSVIGKCKLE